MSPPRRALHSFGRARNGRWTTILLMTLRCYAVVGVAIAVYAFVHALN